MAGKMACSIASTNASNSEKYPSSVISIVKHSFAGKILRGFLMLNCYLLTYYRLAWLAYYRLNEPTHSKITHMAIFL